MSQWIEDILTYISTEDVLMSVLGSLLIISVVFIIGLMFAFQFEKKTLAILSWFVSAGIYFWFFFSNYNINSRHSSIRPESRFTLVAGIFELLICFVIAVSCYRSIKKSSQKSAERNFSYAETNPFDYLKTDANEKEEIIASRVLKPEPYETLKSRNDMTKLFCRYCGKQIPVDSKFCQYCGKEAYHGE